MKDEDGMGHTGTSQVSKPKPSKIKRKESVILF